MKEKFMHSLAHSLKTRGLVSLACLVMLLLTAACGSTGTTSGSGGSGKGNLVIASKLDVESQLIAEMYGLLLKKDGYNVTQKAALGNSTIIFQAITSNQIDIYPEFTATGLNKLGIPSSYNPQKDYQTVKQNFDKKYNLIWLDASPLNDGYALCTTKTEAQKLNITTISQLTPKVSQLSLASPSDGTTFVDGLQKTYGFTTKSFKKTSTVDYNIGFKAVSSGQAQINVCYGTDATVQQQGFVFLQDDKNGFPAFNPAPVVRNAILKKDSDISSVLNPLAPKLTTAVSIQLQNQVANMTKGGSSSTHAITVVAQNFLKQQGML
jgi:osmoprotectant transport system substrate-binding protein